MPQPHATTGTKQNETAFTGRRIRRPETRSPSGEYEMLSDMHSYNAGIAAKLEEVASVLDAQDANPFRVRAYLHAADTIRSCKRPLDELVEAEGIDGIDRLPGIGESLSRSIFQLVRTGRLPMLDRLRGGADPVAVLASVPGIGRKYALVLHDDLGVHSLEELEAAAHDGRLAEVRGFGPKRIAGIRDTLAARLGRIPRNVGAFHADQPSVAEILDVDSEYLEKVRYGKLPLIAPRRFNPTNTAWLPVLHTDRDGRHYTALFSNTAHAHEAGKTDDWVVIYYDADRSQRQYTVITAELGSMTGRRIVRGRERECQEYYFSGIGAAA